MDKTVYKIETEADTRGFYKVVIGYATGDLKDIEDYFFIAKKQTLIITPLTVINVTKELAMQNLNAAKEKRILRKQLNDLEKQVKELRSKLEL